MAKDIVSNTKKSIQVFEIIYLVWRIHELAEHDFEQGRFRRRRYRQQMQQLQMQTSSIHHSPYGHQAIPSFYPPNNSYYMCSQSPPSYHTIYPSPNRGSFNKFTDITKCWCTIFNTNILSFIWSLFNILLSSTLSFYDFVLCKFKWIN